MCKKSMQVKVLLTFFLPGRALCCVQDNCKSGALGMLALLCSWVPTWQQEDDRPCYWDFLGVCSSGLGTQEGMSGRS